MSDSIDKNTTADKAQSDKNLQDKFHNYKFHPNSLFFTICVYGLVFVALSTLLIMAIVNWKSLVNDLRNVLTALTPFVIAFFIAYILNPLVKWFERLLG